MPVTTLDESIAEAKQHLDAARRDGSAADIAEWSARLNARLDRKLVMRAAAQRIT